jgi:CelD/BcsL family acetyltransferase involved in cellulose biosynthesis
MNKAVQLAPVTEVPVQRELAHVSAFAPAMTVHTARSRAEVEEIRQIWSGWPSHRDSEIDFCLDFAWAREEVIRPHVVVIYRDGHPDAMMVGRLERSRLRSKIGYLRLPGIPARVLNFSYGGLLGNPSAENVDAIVKAILTALREGEADMALLDHVRLDSILHDHALRASGFATRDHAIKPELHCFMALPATVDELYRGFSQGLRAEVRRKKKKVLADFGQSVEIRCYRREEEVELAAPALEEVARSTYQRGLGVGFQDTEQMRMRLRFCARKGWLRIYLLLIAGKPCAFWIGTLYNQSFVSDYNSYDPKFRDYSIGTYLLAEVVEKFCQEGVRNIDFGFGQAEYKERFGNSRVDEGSICIFSPGLKGIALNALRTSTGAVDAFARKVLHDTNLLPKMKRLWRSRLAKPAAAK